MMTIIHTILSLAISFISLQTEKPVLLLNGTAHMENGTVITNSAIAIRADSIAMIADATRIRINTDAYEVKDMSSKHIYAAQEVEPNLSSQHQTSSTFTLYNQDQKKVNLVLAENGLYVGQKATMLIFTNQNSTDANHLEEAVLKGKIVSNLP